MVVILVLAGGLALGFRQFAGSTASESDQSKTADTIDETSLDDEERLRDMAAIKSRLEHDYRTGDRPRYPIAPSLAGIETIGLFSEAEADTAGYVDPKTHQTYRYLSQDGSDYHLYAHLDVPTAPTVVGLPAGYNYDLRNDTYVGLEQALAASSQSTIKSPDALSDFEHKISITATTKQEGGLYKTSYELVNSSDHSLFLMQIAVPATAQIQTVINPPHWHSRTRDSTTKTDTYQYVQFNADNPDENQAACETGKGQCGPNVVASGGTVKGFEIWSKNPINSPVYTVGADNLQYYFLEH